MYVCIIKIHNFFYIFYIHLQEGDMQINDWYLKKYIHLQSSCEFFLFDLDMLSVLLHTQSNIIPSISPTIYIAETSWTVVCPFRNVSFKIAHR